MAIADWARRIWFGELELAPPTASTSARCGEAGHGPLADEVALKFRQGREYPENQFPAGRRRVDIGALAGEDAETDASIRKTAHGRDQVLEVTAKAIELPRI